MLSKKAELLSNLSVLQRKEEELANMIMALDSTFRELGYRVDSSVDATKKKVPLQTGIRMKGELSFRGKEKAEEYFDSIDIDKDGFLNYEDFRAMRGFCDPLGYVDAPEVQSSEAWRMFMTDCKLPPNDMGGINKDQFRRFRWLIEHSQPLTRELEALNLGYLPPRMKTWQKLKTLQAEQMDFRDSRLPPGTYETMVAQAAASNARLLNASRNKNSRGGSRGSGSRGVPTEFTPGMRDETFSVDDLSYIICNLRSGLVLSKPEIGLLLLDRAHRRKVLDQLIFKYSKRNLSVPDFPFQIDRNSGQLALQFDEAATVVSTDEIKELQRVEVVPWLMGLPHLFDHKEIYRQAIAWKNYFYRWVRQFEMTTRNMFHFAAHLNDRLIFRDFAPISRVSKVLQEISNFKFGLSIGDESRREGGISGNFKLIKIDTPSVYFKQLKVPSDSGTVLMIDWVFHADTTEEEAHRCAVSTRQFLGHHLEKELRGNKSFSGMLVTTALNEADDAKVLRLIFSYKRIVSVDSWLEHMLIPYAINDLINVLVGDFRSNFDLSEVIANKVTSLSQSFACSIDCTIGLRRNLIIQLLERVILAVSAGVTPTQVNDKGLEENLDLNKSDKKNENNDKNEKLRNIAQEEGNRRVERWKYMHPFFPFIRKWATFFVSTLRCMKNFAMRLKYSDIGDFIFKMGVVYQPFGRFMQRDWTHKIAFLREKFLSFSQRYTTEMSALHLKLKTALEKKKQEDEARRKREIMTQIKEEQESAAMKEEKASTIEKLRRLGIDTHGSDLFKEESTDPIQHLKLQTEEVNKQDVANLIAIENLRKYVIGMHSCELVTGKAKLLISIQGVDIFDVLPDLPNMQSVLDANSLRNVKKKK